MVYMTWTHKEEDGLHCHCGAWANSKPRYGCSYPQHKIQYLKVLQKNKISAEKVRTKVLMYYGGKCACCGYDDLKKRLFGRGFLQIDHIDGAKSGDSSRKYI